MLRPDINTTSTIYQHDDDNHDVWLRFAYVRTYVRVSVCREMIRSVSVSPSQVSGSELQLTMRFYTSR